MRITPLTIAIPCAVCLFAAATLLGNTLSNGPQRYQEKFEEVRQFRLAHFKATMKYEVPREAEWLYWEWQNWEADGGCIRLTIWPNGKSELAVYTGIGNKTWWSPAPGWQKPNSEDHPFELKRTPALPLPQAKQAFKKAWQYGLQYTNPPKANYIDGGGVEIGWKVKGKTYKRVLPWMYERKYTNVNSLRIIALSDVIGMYRDESIAYIWHQDRVDRDLKVLRENPNRGFGLNTEIR